jgi:vacuolar-type H+-ATPase subunit I/STV1
MIGQSLTRVANLKKERTDADAKVRDGLEAAKAERIKAAETLYRERVHEMCDGARELTSPELGELDAALVTLGKTPDDLQASVGVVRRVARLEIDVGNYQAGRTKFAEGIAVELENLRDAEARVVDAQRRAGRLRGRAQSLCAGFAEIRRLRGRNPELFE